MALFSMSYSPSPFVLEIPVLRGTAMTPRHHDKHQVQGYQGRADRAQAALTDVRRHGGKAAKPSQLLAFGHRGWEAALAARLALQPTPRLPSPTASRTWWVLLPPAPGFYQEQVSIGSWAEWGKSDPLHPCTLWSLWLLRSLQATLPWAAVPCQGSVMLGD